MRRQQQLVADPVEPRVQRGGPQRVEARHDALAREHLTEERLGQGLIEVEPRVARMIPLMMITPREARVAIPKT